MKKFFILSFLITGNIASLIAQKNNMSQVNSQTASADSIVISTIDVIYNYPLLNDKNIEELEKKNRQSCIIYPLLILNGIIIREETKINCFRNKADLANIKKAKLITKTKAVKAGIPDIPKDGVLFVTLKKNYLFDFSCE